MPPVLLSAEIRASALRMSKFRGSITFPIFSLSTLSRQHYCSPPKTRYCWLVRPSQTGFSPARLPALRLGAQFRFFTFCNFPTNGNFILQNKNVLCIPITMLLLTLKQFQYKYLSHGTYNLYILFPYLLCQIFSTSYYDRTPPQSKTIKS